MYIEYLSLIKVVEECTPYITNFICQISCLRSWFPKRKSSGATAVGFVGLYLIID